MRPRVVEWATVTSASAWAIYVRLAVALIFLPEGVQKLLYPELLGSGRFARIGIPAPDVMGPFFAWSADAKLRAARR
jgi:putative oxidoreductase